MTDRVNALVVILEKNVRSDDVEPLIVAIRQLRNVLDVKMNIASPSVDIIAETRVRNELYLQVWELFQKGKP